MHDIYHQLVKHSPDFEKITDGDLAVVRDTYNLGAFAITCVLTAIGNLTNDACSNDNYAEGDALRDLNLIGNALQHLPRMAQAFKQNSDTADFVLRKRKEEE